MPGKHIILIATFLRIEIFKGQLVMCIYGKQDVVL